jgi:dynein heavy chain
MQHLQKCCAHRCVIELKKCARYSLVSQMISWLQDHIQLPGYDVGLWSVEHEEKAAAFLNNSRLCQLLCYMSNGKLHCSATLDIGATSCEKLYYFIRSEESRLNDIDMSIHHGMLSRGAAIQPLLEILRQVFGPQLFESSTWPNSVKRDLSGHLHRFMASLTESTFAASRKTVLYLPPGKFLPNIPAAAKNKELVQQLESIVINWTRQIKGVVNSQDSHYHSEVSGPLEEIEFWCTRKEDLCGISEQLQRADVCRVVCVLEASKSSYLARFQSLARRIRDNSVEANDNVNFLKNLVMSCKILASSDLAGICRILPALLGHIRMIWTLSGYYNNKHPERLAGLLRKISHEIICRCRTRVSLSEILYVGSIKNSMVTLKESIKCGVLWKRIYYRTAAAIRLAYPGSPELHWTFDAMSIFAQTDAFVQRCRDLLEVCEGQIQFRRKSYTTEDNSVSFFKGVRGQEVTKSLVAIQNQFDNQISRLRSLKYQILDVKLSHWHEDFNIFKNSVKDLEAMYTNMISASFEGVNCVTEAVGVLQIFQSLAKRDAIKRCVGKKNSDLYLLFIHDVEEVRREFDENRRAPPLRNNEPHWAGSALWAASLAQNVQHSWSLLRAASYFMAAGGTNEAEIAYKALMSVVGEYKASRYKSWVNSMGALDSSTLQAKLDKPLMKKINCVSIIEREFLAVSIFDVKEIFL